MTTLETFFLQRSGKSNYPDKDKFIRLLAELPDGTYMNKIEPIGRIRTIKQNNTFWGLAYSFYKRALTESGNFKDISDEQTHVWCMHHCLPEDYKERIRKEYDEQTGMIDIKTGEVFKSAFRLTTTKMTTIDAIHYYENLQAFYLEWFSQRDDDFIPDPDPEYKKKQKL